MSLKLAASVLAAVAATSAPALACMGPTVIFQDNFQTENPAWSAPFGGTAISGGKAQVTPPPGGNLAFMVYEGEFIDSGDLCVDMVAPTLQDPTSALGGVVFGFNNSAFAFYTFLAREDGQAQIALDQNGAWLNPVSMRAAPALKNGANVTNTLRVTWKGNSVSTYVNGQPFVPFTIPQAFQNVLIGLYAENDAATGTAPFTYQFSNLKVTNVP